MTAIAMGSGSGGGRPVQTLTVLYDAGCRLCRSARAFLESKAQLVPLEFVPAGSVTARQRFPALDHAATLLEITVVADTGDVYVGDGAWLACLWALDSYRWMANRLAQPRYLPAARQIVALAAALRAGSARGAMALPRSTGPDGYPQRDDPEDRCRDDHCG